MKPYFGWLLAGLLLAGCASTPELNAPLATPAASVRDQAFETGGMVNFQLQFARNRHTLPLTRDYIMVKETVYREQLDRWAKA